MRWLKIFAAAGAGLLLVLVTTGAVLIAVTDWNQYRDLLSAALREATGRQVRMSGDVELTLSMTPALVMHDVSLANAPWGTRPQMFKARSLEARVALLPLLRHVLDIDRVVLTDTDLILETDASGKNNWELDAMKSVATGTSPTQNLHIRLASLQINNLRVTLRGGATGLSRTVRLERLSARRSPAGDFLAVDAQGRLNAQPFHVHGRTSTIQSILEGLPFTLALTASAGGAQARIAGKIDKPFAGSGIRLRLAAGGRQLSDLSSLTGTSLPRAGPWKTQLTLEDAPGGVHLSDFTAGLDNTEVSGDLTVSMGRHRPAISGRLRFGQVDISRLLPQKTKNPSRRPAHARRDRIFSDKPLAWGSLNAVDASLALEAGVLRSADLTATGVRAQLALKHGVLKASPVTFAMAGGTVQIDLNADGRQAPPAVRLKLKATKIEVAPLLHWSLGQDLLHGKANVALDLHGRGASVAALMAGLGGSSRVLVGKGTAKLKAVDSLVGGLSKALGTLVARAHDSAALSCLASNFDFKKGLATSRVMVVDTEYSTVYGEGTIALGTEKLDLTLTPKPKSVTLNVAVPVQIEGTLAAPTFTPEKLATARKVVGVLAAVGLIAYPPIALAGLVELGEGGKTPCLAIPKGKAEPAKAAGSAERPSLDRAAQTVKDALAGIGSKLKGLFGN